MKKQLQVVVTGGPGGGKTTALDLFRRELSDKITVVPEAATLLFSGGVTRCDDTEVCKMVQKTIYQLQKNLEEIHQAQYPDRLLVCDRGSLDGLAYWPDSEEDFFKTIDSTFEQELARYDAVIFFESAAETGHDISSNNPVRSESAREAILLDQKLQEVWSKHPKYHFVASSDSFVRKIMYGIMTLENVLNRVSKP